MQGARLPHLVFHIPAANHLRQTMVWRRMRHHVALLTSKRENSHFTGFLRLPTQFNVLAGAVITSLVSRATNGGTLRIAVLGCSNGAEAYTIASILTNQHPGLAFHVRAYDISVECLRTAKSARYRAEEIFNNRIISIEFVRSTFDEVGDMFRVKPDIASHVEFGQGNVLSSDLAPTVGVCDIVFAQNVLFHLQRRAARQALHNIVTLLRRGSVLFIDGVDLDLRAQITRLEGLVPVTDEMERIHDEARRARGVGWPYHYWGLEPFCGERRDAARRYATIFLAP